MAVMKNQSKNARETTQVFKVDNIEDLWKCTANEIRIVTIPFYSKF